MNVTNLHISNFARFTRAFFIFAHLVVALVDVIGCRDGAAVRALASHHCGPGSNTDPASYVG